MVKKTFVDPRNSYIQIDSKDCYHIDLNTASGDELYVEAIIDGEYTKDLLVNIEQEGETVMVYTDFQPNFVFPNDKLSAHKVISVKLNITVPEYHDIRLFGTSSNVAVTGKYKNLEIDLSDGYCELHNIAEHAQVKTQKGGIYLFAAEGDITAYSTYGKVSENAIPPGNVSYDLRSIQGNIYLKRTE
ncbi:hypothetical protein [Allomuricauda sp. SCSIO 65647]|uniref:hypothetical protein n=1 Tax=Allomuricauda sp. SCSIO 65647 TaxID=2908843 RepID=UPI001F208CC6|nr:hypothetical protein [Muricauda sp. SCSIO 65647]UJH66069.1 hypothetical protein L0P89_08780 [Muricauda sp. SCSIO 65647]